MVPHFNTFPELQEKNPQSVVLKRKHSDLVSQLSMTITSKNKTQLPGTLESLSLTLCNKALCCLGGMWCPKLAFTLYSFIRV